jgi:hypothetical protein
VYRTKHIAGGIAAALLLIACARPAYAATRITSVDPKSVQQGDTVLLTIKGEQLPAGNIRLEFFPQQIAVLSTELSSNGAELTAQVKVPPLATPGAYNVMISNQLGDEAFGQALLTIVGTVRTPVFKSYDPKVIAKADSGFALILTGEQLAPEVAPQLSAIWQQDGGSVGGLSTTFTYAPGQIICVVTGRLPNGNLRGKISMAGKPIYQVEVEVRGGAAVIGHTPATIHSADGPMLLKLVGDDLSSGWLSRVKITLRAGKREVPASHVSLRDGASGEVEFTGPLPVGDWTLVVAMDNVAIYQGALTVLPPLPTPKLPDPPAPPPQDLREMLDGLESKQTPTPQRAEVITEVEENPDTDTINNAAIILDSLSPPDDFQMTEVEIAPSGAAALAKPPAGRGKTADTKQIQSATFTPGRSGSPSRLVLTGTGLNSDMVDRLQVEIEYKGGKLQPELSMFTPGGLTYMFPARDGLTDATVVVRDPQNKVATYRQSLALEEGVPTIREQAAGDTTIEAVAASLDAPQPVATAREERPLHSGVVDGSAVADADGFTVTISGAPAGLDWAAAKFSSTHPILALNTAKFTLESPLSGSKTVVHLKRDVVALPDAVFGVLTDMLCDSASVPLRFEFADGEPLEVNAKFARSSASSAESDDGPVSGILH